jgi:hypothetical protein
VTPKRGLVCGLALAGGALFLTTSFRDGWNRAETDFPNYYTAAVLVRKGAPVSRYYDWTWFQRQMNYAGVENQLGGYIPQTPLTMLPLAPLAGFPPQTAKRIWLIANLGFLAATVLMLSRATRLGAGPLALLALAGWGSLSVNFLLGQYYVFLLFLLTLAFYLMHGRRAAAGGFAMGVACALKLYGAPFLLYFAWKRRRRELAGMAAALIAMAALAAAIFGWREIAAYAVQVLPRSLAGETLDPYHPGNGTLSTLLRRAFAMEPELNPHPWMNAPAVYFFLQAFATVMILAIPLVAMRGSEKGKSGFAWFVIVLLLASPNTAPYTYILLLLPVALLLDEAAPPARLGLVALYVVLTLPLPAEWSRIFPKVWLLAALAVLAGRPWWPRLRRRPVTAAASLAICAGALSAAVRMSGHAREPGRRYERVAVERGAIYSSHPAVLRDGIVYESIGPGHYILCRFRGGRIDRFAFDGEALDPVALSPDGPVRFELVAHGKSTFLLLDPATGRTSPAGDGPSTPATSPDDRWRAFTVQQGGSKQVWVQPAGGGPATQITGGACNSFAPVWDLDSRSIVFASDCGRGLGLPALYRARVW